MEGTADILRLFLEEETRLHNLAVTLAQEVAFNYIKDFKESLSDGAIEYLSQEFRKALQHLKKVKK